MNKPYCLIKDGAKDALIEIWEMKAENAARWWALINECLPDVKEEHREKISSYLSSLIAKIINNDDDNITSSFIALQFRVLSKIDDLSKIVFIEGEEFETKTYRSRVTHEMINEMSVMGIDAMVEVENVLSEFLITDINKEIKSGKTIYVNNLVESIVLISEASMAPVISLRTRIKID